MFCIHYSVDCHGSPGKSLREVAFYLVDDVHLILLLLQTGQSCIVLIGVCLPDLYLSGAAWPPPGQKLIALIEAIKRS